jgi:hypothetical protein
MSATPLKPIDNSLYRRGQQNIFKKIVAAKSGGRLVNSCHFVAIASF